MILSNVSPPLLRNLNPEQRRAVEQVDGPLLILAGAGSGKTRVITYRIAHLIESCGVQPENILAVTFTNKAADQMKERVFRLLNGTRSANPLICTFHSLCVRILRKDIEVLGYSRDFAIYDESDQESLMRNCVKGLGLDGKLWTPRAALSLISHAKNHGISPSQFYASAADPRKEQVAVLYEHYEKSMKRLNALDFDDLLVRAVDLLGNFPDVRRRYNEKFKHILVDEYQDTNRTQYRLIRLLTHNQQNLCVVGDEDQSIYRWRGADIQNILSFEQDFPNTSIIKLEQNYRSTQVILDAASAVVANNLARKGKSLWTDRRRGDLIAFFEAHDAENEALFVAQKILESQKSAPETKGAVLYRTNAQSRSFEEAFRRFGIQYHIVGGFSFYERAEIKDILSYLRFCVNPNDTVSLERIINTPPRGIGRSTVEALEQLAQKSGLTLWEAIERALIEKTLAERSLKALNGFRNLIQAIQAKLEQQSLAELIQFVTEASGYRRVLQDEDTEEALARIENLDELMNAAADSVERNETLCDFLDHAALVSDQDDFDEAANVSLMTLHSAKGLEFHMVFVVGLEEGLFPHSRSLMFQEELEEERRLFYVGMTRAQDQLILSRARSRRFYGAESFDITEPSRFLDEIPSELVEDLSRRSFSKKQSRIYEETTYNTVEHIKSFLQKREKHAQRKERSGPPRRFVDSSPSEIKWRSKFRLGSQVRHPKYGVGTVLRSEGEGENLKLSINFQRYGLKKLVERFAGLEEA